MYLIENAVLILKRIIKFEKPDCFLLRKEKDNDNEINNSLTLNVIQPIPIPTEAPIFKVELLGEFESVSISEFHRYFDFDGVYSYTFEAYIPDRKLGNVKCTLIRYIEEGYWYWKIFSDIGIYSLKISFRKTSIKDFKKVFLQYIYIGLMHEYIGENFASKEIINIFFDVIESVYNIPDRNT